MTNIALTQEEMRFVTKVGFARAHEMSTTADIADYDTKRFDLTSRQAHCLGVMVEAATCKLFGLDPMTTTQDQWTAFLFKEQMKRTKDQADILGVVECRRAAKRENPIAIRQKDKALGALVVQGFVEYSLNAEGKITVGNTVEFLGWSNVAEDWSEAVVPGWSNGKSRVVYEKRSMDTFPYDEVLAGAL